jgi:hypothetical protein
MLPLGTKYSAYIDDVYTRVEVKLMDSVVVWAGNFVVSEAFGSRFTVDMKERWGCRYVFGDAIRTEGMPHMSQPHIVRKVHFYDAWRDGRSPGRKLGILYL